MSKNFISGKIYRKITPLIPICCVDVIVRIGKSFLLLKRKEEPMKGKWWFPGGAVLFNESLISTVKRKLRAEANIKRIKKIKFLRVKETKFRKGKFGKPIYTINNIFIVDIDRNQVNNIRIDKTSSDYKIFHYIRRSFSPYIKENLKLVGFKIKNSEDNY